MAASQADTIELREAVCQVLAEDRILNVLGFYRDRVLMDPPMRAVPACGNYLVLTWCDAVPPEQVHELHVTVHRAGREVEDAVRTAVLDRVKQAFTTHRPPRGSPIREVLPRGRWTDGQVSGPRRVVAAFDVTARSPRSAWTKQPTRPAPAPPPVTSPAAGR